MSGEGRQSGESWRVVIFTDIGGQVVPSIHRQLTAAGHRVVGVVTGPGPKRRRTDDYIDVVRSVPAGIDVIVTTNMGRLAALLAPLRPDLIVSMGFKWRIPAEVLNLPPFGVINVHLGLLPMQRGANSFGWALRNDDREIGVTIHRMDEGFDTGPILAQSRVPIGDDDTFGTLLMPIFGTIPALLVQALARVAQGDPGDPQDESRAFYADLFTPDWREIDWSRPARTVHNQVRSWFGGRGTAHGAFGVIDGARVLVTKTRLVGDEGAGLAPGATARRDDGALLVGCGDGALAIIEWAPTEAGDGADAATPATPGASPRP